jgi:uncharacterized damage-inducible protein DinB
MNATDVRLLFEHLYFMRDRILTAAGAAEAAGVPIADEAAVTIRDLRATLVHEVDVEWSWRERLRGPDPTRFSPDDEELKPTDFPDVASIAARWKVDEAEMRAWLEGLDDEALAGPCRAENGRSHPLWFHVQHIYTHAIQQLSDAAVLLTRADHSPGELDFLDFVEQRLD